MQFFIDSCSELVWPNIVSEPERRHELWQSTCFECFIGLDDDPAYLEINLVPSGDWQAYAFSSYREAQSTSDHVSVKLLSATPQKFIQFSIDITDPRFVTADWKISACCVLACENGEGYYMCAQHPVDKPDFHTRASRVFTLPANTL